eukprot:CAMPEP_0176477746 /NCGR_PEP_ID=MMETSP0200_2-20121128/801_1 /TAXON_ID=947934 /ORGANISM="Chaetoceros sp., Strain GSL56" /LENGTH=251 /DNA_ID=CAMNT_0017873605 /DNA_START=201 /DNA_END=956 /DNA_ORIENTATION=+
MTKNTEINYGAIPTAEPVVEEQQRANVRMVEVPAPATLQEGFKFRAIYEGVQFPVVVPAGGCVVGQILTVPFNPDASDAPTRAWKDDIFACTRYGIFHPSFLTAWCFPLILLGQVMTRLKMNWLAQDAQSGGQWRNTFRTMIYITLGYIFLNLILSPADPNADNSVLYNILVFVYSMFMIYLVTKVRREVRRRNEIPEERCIGCEDIVCAAFCGCCTVSQLARQTADYDMDEGQFMTPDGLSHTMAPVLNV